MVVLLWGLWCGGCYWSCCDFAGSVGCYGFDVILQVDFAVVVSMVFAMILQVFAVGAAMVGW